MAFPISTKIFAAFHRCNYKAHLLLAGHPGQKTDFEIMQEKQERTYRPLAEAEFVGARPGDSVAASPPTALEAITHGHDIITDARLVGQDAIAHVDALLRARQRVIGEPPQYLPVLYVPHERLSKDDKLLLGFCASVLAELQREPPGIGLVIHGAGYTEARIRLPVLMASVSEARARLASLASGFTPPTPRPNTHCHVCEFREHCRPLAERNGDLRLLRGLGEKEEAKLNRKGIFNITQLSYTFRPRRRRKAKPTQPAKHSHALQALAIRTSKIYVTGTPQLPTAPTRLFLDIENVPDRDFTYLIGVLVSSGEIQQYHPFWANGPDEEAAIWRSFLQLLESLPPYVLYHYGSFDARIIRRLRTRHGGDQKQLDLIEAASFNVLSAVYGGVFFPTYSNGLKDIATSLGFKWSEPNASGIQSLVWRQSWDETHDDDNKRKLISYNHDDCRALHALTNLLGSIITNGPAGTSTTTLPIASTDDLPDERRRWFGNNEFVFPELEKLNRCAYFDYQRERVFVRTSPAVRISLRRSRLRNRTTHAVNAEVILPRPVSCPVCNATEVSRHQGVSKVVYDLKRFKGGIKRRVVRYLSCRYLCKRCNKIFTPHDYTSLNGTKFGRTLIAWCIYESIELLHSQSAITQQLGELFAYRLKDGIISRFKAQTAERLQPAYEEIKAAIKSGSLVHADETKVRFRSGSGYVWVFTNLEEVLYVYSETREGDTPKTILEGFKGVLVSDFYTAYDSIDCPQQKCLIHFIRDMNSDLLANPFDDELKALAREFTDMIVPIIETVDCHGLKTCHMRRHKPKMQRLLDRVDGSNYTSESAKDYQRRLRKYGSRMFTFLDHDGVPWNNNNAENAVKRFAFLRNVVGSNSTPEGIRQYLVLLSICETLKRKGVSFLNFLASGEVNLAVFIGRQ